MVLAFSEDSGGVAPTPPKKIELIVNARQSGPQPGAGEAVAGQAIRLFTPATVAQALPGAPGAVKNDAGFDQDPMQCTTGQDGACAIALPVDQFPVSATYEADADVTGQAGVNAWPGPAAGPVAGLFAFGFMPAMPLAYDGLILNPGGTEFGNFNDVLIATDGTKWCTYGDGGPQSTPITPKSLRGGQTTDGGTITDGGTTTTTIDEPFPPPPPEPGPEPLPEPCTVPQKSTVPAPIKVQIAHPQSLKSALLAALALLGAPEARAADSDILFVFDGSGSMRGQINGVAKIETARQALKRLMNDVPAESRLGLMTYSAAPGTRTTPPRARQAWPR